MLYYHVFDRRDPRQPFFWQPEDFGVFEALLVDARERFGFDLFAYCLMPTHWHLVVRVDLVHELKAILEWIKRRHAAQVYARYKSARLLPLYEAYAGQCAIRHPDHFQRACRYVERNPKAAGLVRRAEEWRWSSLWRREHGMAEWQGLLSPWPGGVPVGWLELVNAV